MISSSRRVTASAFDALGLTDWRFLLGRAEAVFHCGSYAAAGTLAGRIAEAADRLGHHPMINLRAPDVLHVVCTTRVIENLTEADLELCRIISGLAAGHVITSEPTRPTTLEIAIDALDIPAVRPFWAAVLDYVDAPADNDGVVRAVVDPLGVSPAVWFQQMSEPRPQRNRIHFDVTVAHDVADRRIAATLAAGGRLLSDRAARAFWILADPEGNEACICTWQDRGN
ncbi:VOC family protein [Microlunatus speluncae]|uniref:VOC family protein n=1 Tax=Microlunatus speluncae TaxID=2594267 RepID=UPI0012663E18|nr:VOC family protein [Microlunatus speluncae]